jgi:hypothetical protein
MIDVPVALTLCRVSSYTSPTSICPSTSVTGYGREFPLRLFTVSFSYTKRHYVVEGRITVHFPPSVLITIIRMDKRINSRHQWVEGTTFFFFLISTSFSRIQASKFLLPRPIKTVQHEASSLAAGDSCQVNATLLTLPTLSQLDCVVTQGT